MTPCPWCRRETPHDGKLCPDCYGRAMGSAKLSHRELDRLPFGVIELGTEDNILSFNRAEEQSSHCRAKDVVGKNFFREVAPCTQVKEYEGRYKEFLKSNKPSEEFDFIYSLRDGAVNVHIVFVRAQKNNFLIVSKEAVI